MTLGSFYDLSPLASFHALRYLAIRRVRGVSDLSVLSELPAWNGFGLTRFPRSRRFRTCPATTPWPASS